MHRVISVLIIFTITSTTSALAQNAASDPVQFKRKFLDFGTRIESTCTSRKVQVTNISETAIPDPAFRTEDPKTFPIQQRFRKCPNPLKPGETCRIYVNFCPPFVGNYQTRLYFKDTSVYLPMGGRGRAGV